MIGQRTLQNVVRATGVGVHSGEKVLLTLRPAPVNTGIVFRRRFIEGNYIDIPAKPENVVDTRYCTTIGCDGTRIGTIEHLLSAFAGLGIDNVIVEVSADEVPIMDGSATIFVMLVQSAGIVEQAAPKKFIRILKPIKVEEGDKWAKLEPYEGFKVDFKINFDHPVIRNGIQTATLNFSSTTYVKEISRARTFGFLADFESLRAHNLALGGSLDNAIVLDDYRILNEEGLRYKDEFVRHKVLDAVGDLYLLGHSLIGAFTGYKSGHALNNKLIATLLQNADAFEVTSFEVPEKLPIAYFPGTLASAS